MDFQKLSKIFKALASDSRLSLFVKIATHQESDFEEDACVVSNLMSLFKISAPTISHHLKELSNADLITTEKRGKYLIARINYKTLEEVADLLNVLKKESSTINEEENGSI